MGAQLQLVSPMPAARPAIMQVQHEPRVFTASFLERLAQLNRIERELRRPAGPEPQARLIQAELERHRARLRELMADRVKSKTISKQGATHDCNP